MPSTRITVPAGASPAAAIRSQDVHVPLAKNDLPDRPASGGRTRMQAAMQQGTQA